jgi:hypothetical protein
MAIWNYSMVSFPNIYNRFPADGSSFFYALISLMGIMAFCGTINDTRKSGKSLHSFLKDMGAALWTFLWTFLFGVHRLALAVVVLVLYYVPLAFFRCLPLNVKAPVRSVWRHGAKTGIGVGQKAEIMMMEFKTEIHKKINAIGRYQAGDGPHTPTLLSEFLGIYDMLILVTENLHYIDVIRLSQVSKSVRESVLPSHDLARRLNVFKLYTCVPDQRTTCWTCSNQICHDCQQLPEVPQTTVLHHLSECQPYCTPCYRTHVLRPSSDRARLADPNCHCAPVPRRPRNPYNWFMNGNGYYTRAQTKLTKVARPVCRECNKLTSKEVLALKEKQAKMQLKLGLKSDGEKWTICARPDCGRALGTGPRYWVCTRYDCKKECSSTLHKAIGQGMGDGKGDKVVVGEEAV